ncbi:MAG: hypothetical protein LBI79_06515 [Nitrososphaerota archaeon]|jgi:hypothetical protein|nr:hypothetical protein [Nitrososphaerota archaeon]
MATAGELLDALCLLGSCCFAISRNLRTALKHRRLLKRFLSAYTANLLKGLFFSFFGGTKQLLDVSKAYNTNQTGVTGMHIGYYCIWASALEDNS